MSPIVDGRKPTNACNSGQPNDSKSRTKPRLTTSCCRRTRQICDDKSRLSSVCAPRITSWCACSFFLSRLRANRGAQARKFRVCVEKRWGPPPPFSQHTLSSRSLDISSRGSRVDAMTLHPAHETNTSSGPQNKFLCLLLPNVRLAILQGASRVGAGCHVAVHTDPQLMRSRLQGHGVDANSSAVTASRVHQRLEPTHPSRT